MYYNLTALILSREPFREDDLLATVYSAEKGKIVLQARSAKKIKSKLAGHLEPVTLSNLNVTIGKNIDQLIGAQIIKPFTIIKNDIKKLAYASYFLELINSLTQENHPDKRIFYLLEKSFDYLAKTDSNYPLIRISFGYKLLHLLGFNPTQKLTVKLKDQVNYIVKNNVNNIIKNTSIIKNLSALNKILDQELEIHLEKELKTKEFLKKLKN